MNKAALSEKFVTRSIATRLSREKLWAKLLELFGVANSSELAKHLSRLSLGTGLKKIWKAYRRSPESRLSPRQFANWVSEITRKEDVTKVLGLPQTAGGKTREATSLQLARILAHNMNRRKTIQTAADAGDFTGLRSGALKRLLAKPFGGRASLKLRPEYERGVISRYKADNPLGEVNASLPGGGHLTLAGHKSKSNLFNIAEWARRSTYSLHTPAKSQDYAKELAKLPGHEMARIIKNRIIKARAQAALKGEAIDDISLKELVRQLKAVLKKAKKANQSTQPSQRLREALRVMPSNTAVTTSFGHPQVGGLYSRMGFRPTGKGSYMYFLGGKRMQTPKQLARSKLLFKKVYGVSPEDAIKMGDRHSEGVILSDLVYNTALTRALDNSVDDLTEFEVRPPTALKREMARRLEMLSDKLTGRNAEADKIIKRLSGYADALKAKKQKKLSPMLLDDIKALGLAPSSGLRARLFGNKSKSTKPPSDPLDALSGFVEESGHIAGQDSDLPHYRTYELLSPSY